MTVAIYAAVLALFFVYLSFKTIGLRRSLQIGVGHGGDVALLRAMRVHANFAEYVPMALLLIYLVEVGGAPVWLIHVLGLVLLVGRVLHAFGVSQVQERMVFRVSGMVMTFTVMISAALFLIGRWCYFVS